MVQAYILIQTEVGKARDVATAIQTVPGVVKVDAVTGPYDVVVLTESNTVDELGKMIVSRVQAVPGITRTLTCSVVNLLGNGRRRSPQRGSNRHADRAPHRRDRRSGRLSGVAAEQQHRDDDAERVTASRCRPRRSP